MTFAYAIPAGQITKASEDKTMHERAREMRTEMRQKSGPKQESFLKFFEFFLTILTVSICYIGILTAFGILDAMIGSPVVGFLLLVLAISLFYFNIDNIVTRCQTLSTYATYGVFKACSWVKSIFTK